MDPSTSSSISLRASERTKRTEHFQEVVDNHCRIILFDHQGEMTHVYDVVFLYQTIGRIVIDVVEVEADIGGKPLFFGYLIQTDV